MTASLTPTAQTPNPTPIHQTEREITQERKKLKELAEEAKMKKKGAAKSSKDTASNSPGNLDANKVRAETKLSNELRPPVSQERRETTRQ